MRIERRHFLKAAGLASAGFLIPGAAPGAGIASRVQIAQLVYPGGNWQPRPTALRRLAWEVRRRTAVDMGLEPTEVKPTYSLLSQSPLLYLSGDRPFPPWGDSAAAALSRFVKLGGMIIVDPAYTAEGDKDGFERAVDAEFEKILQGTKPQPVPRGHVVYRSFYQIERPVGRIEGPESLVGYSLEGRLAAVRTRHDLGGAWARDNLGNWEFDVTPGGVRQREEAFRLGINLVLYALCLDYKDETPHRRFGAEGVKR